MKRIDKIVFNAEEAKTIENFCNLVEELYEMDFYNETTEIDIEDIYNSVNDFFFNNKDIVLSYDEENEEE